MKPDYDCVTDTIDILGEGPVWSEAAQALHWVDIRGHKFRRMSPGAAVETWPMPDMVASFALHSDGRVLMAMRQSLVAFHPATGALETMFRLDVDDPDRRFNEGKCDRSGRFLVGTMSDRTRLTSGVVSNADAEGAGVLYRFDAGYECERLFGDIHIPNCLAWSPDGRLMYFADTARGAIYRYRYDADSGALGPRELFATTSTKPGRPDGGTVDAEGFLWCTDYGGWTITRYDPNGRIERIVTLPVEQPTSCAFGGANLDILYVTTAAQRLSPEQLARQPHAGKVLALDTGARGLPEPLFEG
ncbi:MAG: SMP-30/gluconolactonase/LRE family protein [Xanthobacteraceae bacterium]